MCLCENGKTSSFTFFLIIFLVFNFGSCKKIQENLSNLFPKPHSNKNIYEKEVKMLIATPKGSLILFFFFYEIFSHKHREEKGFFEDAGIILRFSLFFFHWLRFVFQPEVFATFSFQGVAFSFFLKGNTSTTLSRILFKSYLYI